MRTNFSIRSIQRIKGWWDEINRYLIRNLLYRIIAARYYRVQSSRIIGFSQVSRTEFNPLSPSHAHNVITMIIVLIPENWRDHWQPRDRNWDTEISRYLITLPPGLRITSIVTSNVPSIHPSNLSLLSNRSSKAFNRKLPSKISI